MGPRTLLQGSRLLPVEGTGTTVPRRRLLRVLPYRPEPRKAAGERRSTTMGESELDGRCAIFLGRPHLCMERRPVHLLFPFPAYGAAGLARHIAGDCRQHEQ